MTASHSSFVNCIEHRKLLAAIEYRRVIERKGSAVRMTTRKLSGMAHSGEGPFLAATEHSR